MRLIKKKLMNNKFGRNIKKFPFILVSDLMKLSQIKQISNDDIGIFYKLLLKLSTIE